jgi:hypothetical protein
VPTVISPSTVNRARLRRTPVSAFTATVAVLSIPPPADTYLLMAPPRRRPVGARQTGCSPTGTFFHYVPDGTECQ